MFFAQMKRLKERTAFRLSTTIAFVLLVCLFGLNFAIQPLVKSQVLLKEQKLIEYRFNQYIELFKQSGYQRLIQQIRSDDVELQLLGIEIRISDEKNTTLWKYSSNKKTADAMNRNNHYLSFEEGNWTMVYKPASLVYKIQSAIVWKPDKDIMVRYKTGKLDNRLTIQVGQSLRRMQEMVGVFSAFFKYSILIFAIIIFVSSAILIQLALNPLRNMLKTIHLITAGDMTARVSVRNSKNDIGQVANMFNHMLNKTESLVIRMKESLDNVAHDLRTPLSRMQLSIEEAVQQKDPNRLREALFDCAEEAEKLTRTLKTLMDISEAEAETLNLYPREINLRDLIQDSVKQYDFMLEGKGLGLNLHFCKDLIILADADRLSQAMNNLIDNAIKYTLDGGKIDITTRDNSRSVHITIKDDGIGIHPDDLNRIFERLYRADKSRSTKGLGLGLSLVKAVLQAHGSEIKVQSKPGQGAEFHILFPKNYQKDGTLDWQSVGIV